MEEDRAQVDLGIAADIEERQEEATAQRQPKKRFVGRRQAAEAAFRNGGSTSVEESGAVTSIHSDNILLSNTSADTSIQSQLHEEPHEPSIKSLPKS
jgi:hypothetical protein